MSRIISIVFSMGVCCGILSLLACSLEKAQLSESDDLSRTWLESRIYIPYGSSSVITSPAEAGKLIKRAGHHKLPVAIYLHGCSGFWAGTDRRAKFLVALGFAVIAPDSFARTSKPISCIPQRLVGGLDRGTLSLRQAEAANAIENAKKLSWVDEKNIILLGFSEGGITAATLGQDSYVSISAVIIEGWGCHSSWHEYQGLKTPKNTPVLSLVAAQDPWFQHPDLHGHCGQFLKNVNSKSIFYKNTPLLYEHSLLDFTRPREDIVKFLNKNLKWKP